MSDAALKVVPINTPDLSDIPRCLRELADKIERGEYAAYRQAAVVASDVNGDMRVHTFGDCPNAQQTVGLLQWGIHWMIAN